MLVKNPRSIPQESSLFDRKMARKPQEQLNRCGITAIQRLDLRESCQKATPRAASNVDGCGAYWKERRKRKKRRRRRRRRSHGDEGENIANWELSFLSS